MNQTPIIILWKDHLDEKYPYIEGQVPKTAKGNDLLFTGFHIDIRNDGRPDHLRLLIQAERDRRPILAAWCQSLADAKSVAEFFAVNMMATFDQIKDRNCGE